MRNKGDVSIRLGAENYQKASYPLGLNYFK